jgi:nucleoside-diphosphate-sugar epimerase
VSGEVVLVTGGSGFVAAHCILRLLDAGYTVRTTVRSLDAEPRVRHQLRVGGAQPDGRLTVVAADLLRDEGWPEAVAGVRYVLHVASPFPAGIPKSEDELVRPAREGALRVLRAARDAGVARLVQTSSFAAVGYGQGPRPPERPFTEDDWTDPERAPTAYVKSKTLAERAAWDFMAREGGSMEFATVNPVGVLGPVLGPDTSASIEVVKRLLDGSIPGSPHLWFGYVDARDVADLQLRAMTAPAAAGQRFLAVAGPPISMHDIAVILKTRLGEAARRVPTRTLPDWVVRLFALFDKSIAQVVPDLDEVRHVSAEKARRVLGWEPRSAEEAVVATGESLVRLGLVKPAGS